MSSRPLVRIIASQMRRVALLLSCVAVLAVCAVGTTIDSKPAAAAPAPWWNSSYGHRYGITIKASSSAVPSGYSISVTLNHAALVSAGASLSSGNDVRVAYYNGSTWTELDRLLQPASAGAPSAWNTASTKLWFKTQAGISANASDTSYYIYYGYSSAGSPPADGNNIFTLFEDFSSGSINGSKWITDNASAAATVAVSGGELRVTGPSTIANSDWAGIETVSNAFTNSYAVDVNFRVASQSSLASQWFGTMPGFSDRQMYLYGGSYPSGSGTSQRSTGYNDGVFGWHPLDPIGFGGTSFSYHRISATLDGNNLGKLYDDGTLVGTRASTPNAVDGQLRFLYMTSVYEAATTFDVRFDDIIVRKFVAAEPLVVLDQTSDVGAALGVLPNLAFTINTVLSAVACGDTTTNVASTSNSVSLGRLTSTTQHMIGAQNLNVITNAASGYTVYVSAAGALTGASTGATVANLASTNAAPATWPANGTAGFGYSTATSGLSGTAARFRTNKWAAFSSTPTEVMRNTTTPGTSGDTNCVAIQASKAGNTPSDVYTTTVRYNAVPSF